MNAASAEATTKLIDELQSALTHGSVARRVETLRRITDLFTGFAVDYSGEQIALFDDVFIYLVGEIETSAKALLASRLAPIDTAPPRIIHTLAFDDAIEVAGPVLSLSRRLGDDALIENARSKSQGHLLAISKRETLSAAVTDALIERGNEDVLDSAANNPGADFSDRGFGQLVSRSERSDRLTTSVGLRRNISRPQYLKLIARASDSVRAKLEAAREHPKADIERAVDDAALQAHNGQDGLNEETSRARTLVKSLHEDGRLDEVEVTNFATAGKFDEIAMALGLLTNFPVAKVETMMLDSRTEGLLVLAKVAGLSWSTLEIIVSMRSTLLGTDLPDMSEYRSNYDLLRLSAAQQVLRFHKMQNTTDQTPALSF
jgi:uncharacterized protein (DUF2336 family)